jgi:hypothetical protein
MAVFLALFTACVSSPPQVEDTEPEAPQIEETVTETEPETLPEPGVVEEAPPDSGTVTQDIYEQTLADVRQFIESLNRIISSKNYNAWRNTLSGEYFAKISSSEFLAKQSESPLLSTRKIVLRSPNDYFTHVVVPSRANSRVDQIEFKGDTVWAYYTDPRPERGRLKVKKIKKIGNEWKIVE